MNEVDSSKIKAIAISPYVYYMGEAAQNQAGIRLPGASPQDTSDNARLRNVSGP
jgi:hypothetical protein